jgi:ribosomal-protein-alanine N-acetyltransferase
MQLRLASLNDLNTIVGWIDNAHALRIWAGSGMRYPPTADTLKEDILFSEKYTFSLTDDQDQLIGFGQVLERLGRLHLARIIVAPERRGKGFGRVLCENLIQEGIKRFGKKDFSLNVYQNNDVAIKLYESLGFRVAADQRPAPGPDSVFMIKTG